jgi:hypothetical protein
VLSRSSETLKKVVPQFAIDEGLGNKTSTAVDFRCRLIWYRRMGA